MAGKLTTKAAETLTLKRRHTPGRHTDGDGLHLHVRATGEASWVLRYRLHGAQRDLSLGGFPQVSLKAAREAAAAARALVKLGKDPVRERQRAAQEAAEAASRDRTFQAAAEALLEARAAEWRNEKHRWQWRATLAKHAFPAIGALPVAEVDTAAVLRVLRPVWTETPETASRLRGRIESVLDFAQANGWRSGENPARWKGNLAELLPRPDKLARVRHQPALPLQQVPAFMAALRERKGTAALALRFAILTAARTGEVRGMTWGEVDFEARVWVVPGARMKMGQLHRVPLSDAALAVLAEVHPGTPRPDALVFPGARAGAALSDMALTMVVRGMATDGVPKGEPPRWRDTKGRVVVPHGFRSSFRDWCGETRPEGREVAERALAHVVRGVEGAYARSDLLEKRRPLMAAWAEWCGRPAGGAEVKHFAAERAG
jgi:integrase